MSSSETLKKALLAIKKLKHELHNKAVFQPIAIVGMSCRLPQANNKNAFWDLLTASKNVISPIPQERWNLLKGSEESINQDQAKQCRGGFLNDIQAFDAYFFGITPREAMRMDPQQRILLELAHEALEDAGIPLDALAGSNTGVFSSLYLSQFAHMQKLEADMDALYIPTGNAVSMAANRLSYLFDLHGPSLTLDTACSSSLVALHLACLNLQAGQCDLALACAANINFSPSMNLLLSKAKMLSPEGQCKTFDASADGYVQGEGVGVIVLKPLAQALVDKDRIYAVITGSAVNQDGKTNGLTAPNGAQQEALLKSAYQAAGIDPLKISYVECHGTGTFLGDPIEIEALGTVLSPQRQLDQACVIGSVKTNLGHLEPAAGIVSMIKVALSLQHKQIPAHLNFNQPNPHIAFDKYAFQVPKTLQAWPDYALPRTAGISGFGFGGTNAHIVMRELAEHEKIQIHKFLNEESEIFTLSAKDPIALKQLIQKWCIHLQNNPHLSLSQICYNLHVRRSHHICRLAVVTNSVKALCAILSEINLDGEKNPEHVLVNIQPGKIQFHSSKQEHSLLATAKAYVNREAINWKEQEAHRSYPHDEMPLYPWQHKDYWPQFKSAQATNLTDHYPFTRERIASPLANLQYEFLFDTKTMPEIADSFNFLHAGFYLEMLAIASLDYFSLSVFTIENCVFSAPIFIPNNSAVKVHLILNEIDKQHYQFTFYSCTHGKDWIKHTAGDLCLHSSLPRTLDTIDQIKSRCFKEITAEDFFAKVTAMRMPSGDSIRWTEKSYINDNEIICDFKEPESAKRRISFKLEVHPGIIDGCVQSLFMLLPEKLTQAYIASSIKKLTYYGSKSAEIYFYGVLNQINIDGDKYSGDFYLIGNDGTIIAECLDLCMTKLNIQFDLGLTNQDTKIDLKSLTPQACKQIITDYLIAQVAKVFSMPVADIAVHQSLRDLGIDSLMSIVLSAAIDSDLGASYSMQDILQGPSIAEIAEVILATVHTQTNQTASTQAREENPWIAYRKPQKNAKIRLFCFPYGGSGASIYSDWQKDLPGTIEICPIQLPGREGRMNEASLNDIESLISALIKHLQNDFDLPFAFLGHSFGALIAFELARALRKLNFPQPAHLFVSAFPDPCIPTKSLDNLIYHLQKININLFDLQDRQALTLLSEDKIQKISAIFTDNGLLEYGSLAMSTDIVKILLPIFIADMSLVKSYHYQHDFPLNFPITIFLGLKDTWVAYADHLGWRKQTQKECDIHEFNRGHLFIKDPEIKHEILQIIQGSLASFIPSQEDSYAFQVT